MITLQFSVLELGDSLFNDMQETEMRTNMHNG